MKSVSTTFQTFTTESSVLEIDHYLNLFNNIGFCVKSSEYNIHDFKPSMSMLNFSIVVNGMKVV